MDRYRVLRGSAESVQSRINGLADEGFVVIEFRPVPGHSGGYSTASSEVYVLMERSIYQSAVPQVSNGE